MHGCGVEVRQCGIGEEALEEYPARAKFRDGAADMSIVHH